MAKYIIIFMVLYAIYLFFEEKIKGSIGEKLVANRLSGLPKQSYRVLNDVLIKTDYGTTQIDHIVVSIYGIFVIETKYYKGWIIGNDYSDYWTQNLYGKKYKFRNPLKQNYAHVKALQEKMDLEEDKLIPIVAFSSRSTLKVKTKNPVIYIGQVKKVIREYKESVFQENELDMLVEKIQVANIISKEARKEHIKQIKTKVYEKENKAKEAVCPRCGGQLVHRTGKNGDFIGCSNFPKCRYTRNKSER